MRQAKSVWAFTSCEYTHYTQFILTLSLSLALRFPPFPSFPMSIRHLCFTVRTNSFSLNLQVKTRNLTIWSISNFNEIILNLFDRIIIGNPKKSIIDLKTNGSCAIFLRIFFHSFEEKKLQYKVKIDVARKKWEFNTPTKTWQIDLISLQSVINGT